MSASPADRTPGRTPNGGAPVMRRPKNADPLVRPKDKQKRRLQRPPPVNGHSNQEPNGQRLHGYGQPQPPLQHIGRPTPPFPRPSSAAQPTSENIVSGFSSAPVAPYTDFPVFMSKRALMEGFRHHVARFSSKKNVDIRNTDEFVRPVRLHRRDPRAPPANAGVKSEDQAMMGMEIQDDKQREKEEILKAERDAVREAEAALVAPAINSGGQKKLGSNLKKTEQIYRNDQTEEQKAKSKLRYEEALPWHLEDFDNKSTWVGSYEAALSDTYAMMVQGQDGAFRMVPLEKWYKLTQKNQFKTLTIEEAESRFNKKVKEPRWFMDSEESKKKRQFEQENKKASSGLFLGKWEKGGGGSGVAAPVTKQENADADDLDFTEDRFADDEENMLFEEDDETKEAEERIKRDQLQANIFGLKEEKEYEKQDQLEKKEKDAEKKLGKHVKKALMKREKNYIYDSDSTDNPYSTEVKLTLSSSNIITNSHQSESDSTETERQKEEERKKDKSTPDKPASKSKLSSGSSSKGTNTPSRPSKHSDPLSRTASSTNLKRPGSPLGSEASGNESSRKKHKKKHHLLSSQSQLQQSNLQPPSRPTSPPVPAPSSSTTTIPAKRPRPLAGSGSDSETAVAASGNEMSDGTRKRIKLKLGMPKNTSPGGSRGGSPEAVGTRGGGASPPGATPDLPFPTAADLRAHIPVTGIKMGDLLQHFRGQVVGDERKNRFTRLMRENSRYVKETKMLVPLDA